MKVKIFLKDTVKTEDMRRKLYGNKYNDFNSDDIKNFIKKHSEPNDQAHIYFEPNRQTKDIIKHLTGIECLGMNMYGMNVSAFRGLIGIDIIGLYGEDLVQYSLTPNILITIYDKNLSFDEYSCIPNLITNYILNDNEDRVIKKIGYIKK